MAETSAGGCVRSAARSSASTRPSASASGTAPRAAASTPSSTRCERLGDRQQRHVSYSFARYWPRFAAALLDQPDALDAHAALDRLHHVVDGQAGDRDGGERLHLDAGLARRP